MTVPEIAIVDGVEHPLAAARLPLTDAIVVRGDAAFESIGVWSGRPFRLDDHLDRLDRSLTALRLPPADRTVLVSDLERALARGLEAAGSGTADAILRCVVTATGTRIITVGPQPQRPPLLRLEPLLAPWVDGSWALAGAKTTSYAANMTLGRIAAAAGADDALLVSRDGHVLEGPTFGVAWVADGVLRVPDVSLGIIDSISRRVVVEVAIEAGMPVESGRWPVSDLLEADAVVTSSAVRPVQALEELGSARVSIDRAVVRVLADGLEDARRAP